jgi:anti-anti-sigma factor
MELQIVDTGSEVTRLKLTGRMDTMGAMEIETRFTAAAAANQKSAVVDVSEVPFLASMGIRLLVTVAKALARQGNKLILLAPQELVADVIEMSAIDSLVSMAADEEGVQAILSGN